MGLPTAHAWALVLPSSKQPVVFSSTGSPSASVVAATPIRPLTRYRPPDTVPPVGAGTVIMSPCCLKFFIEHSSNRDGRNDESADGRSHSQWLAVTRLGFCSRRGNRSNRRRIPDEP